jgi:hypothetical protein
MFRVDILRFILDLDLDPSVTTTLVDVSLVLLQQVCHILFPRVFERPVPDSPVEIGALDIVYLG